MAARGHGNLDSHGLVQFGMIREFLTIKGVDSDS